MRYDPRHVQSRALSRPPAATLEALSRDIAFATLADPARKASVLGCAPSGPGDETCLRSFRVCVILRVILQAPEFVYRVELGEATDEPGVYALDDCMMLTDPGADPQMTNGDQRHEAQFTARSGRNMPG